MKLSLRNYRFILIAFSVIILAAAGISPARGQENTASRKPAFKLLDLDGRMNDLGELRGNVVLISFGATWCAPCTTELRALEEVLKEYKSKPVKFFWVSIESPEEVTNAALRRYAKQRKVSFPVLRDFSQAVFMQFTPRVRLPLIVMLAKDGHVDQPVQFGMRSPADVYKSDIRARLNKLLAAQSESDR
jgi:thiol-disulfide isomerase/thioredoxin